jgi:hypothetical protein
MKKYALPMLSKKNNSYIFTANGVIQYRTADLEAAKRWLQKHVAQLLLVDTNTISFEEIRNTFGEVDSTPLSKG